MPKFFVNNEQVNNETITIQGKDINHIKNVLRMKVGDTLPICIKDNQKDCIVEIKNISEEKITCEIIKYEQNNTEPNIQVSIFQGLPKSDKMELVIQKSVELGVYNIYPIEMARCVVQLKNQDKKIARWQTIAEVASKQSGRSKIPKIENCMKILDICNIIPEYDSILVAYEEEKDNTLKTELQLLKEQNKKLKIGIVIGPEGGLEHKEVEQLKSSGAKVITLGNRILRTETVALNVLSNIIYEFEK